MWYKFLDLPVDILTGDILEKIFSLFASIN